MFGEYSVDFQEPWWLLLLGLIPVMWVFSFRSLAGLGRLRRAIVLTLRTLVAAILICAIAGIQMVQTRDRLTVIYLIDQSRSIPQEQRDRIVEYVNAAIAEHRDNEDRAGVIVFGRDAAVEVQPLEVDIRAPRRPESLLDPNFTNLEAAMKMAEAAFKEDTAKRVVIVSDGNQNLGNALGQAQSLREKGIGIDVVAIHYPQEGEVLVEKLTRPVDIRKGQPFDLRVVLTNTSNRPVPGRLEFLMTTDDEPIVLNPRPEDQKRTLDPGKNVYSLRQQIDQPHFYEYEAVFHADNPGDDGMVQNNRATIFAHVRGEGHVLIVENFEYPGEYEFLAEKLRDRNLEVTVKPSNQAFGGLAELQQYDTVVLGNVPHHASEPDAEGNFRGAHLTDEQVEMLVSNTQHMGAGLVMIGGPHSYGAGGWADSELEKAMPLDFTIKNAKVVPKGALAMVMHASEIPQGNHWQKIIGREALKVLGSQDYCGVVEWNGNVQWLWNHPQGLVKVGGNKAKMIARLARMTPGDMPDFDPSLKLALKGFNGLKDVASKHMVVISDGDPSPPSPGVVQGYITAKVTVTTVAVGSHGTVGNNVMQSLAAQTGGKYYRVLNNKALPRIFQKEARRVARPLIYEEPPPFSPVKVAGHQMLQGIDELPPIRGYVMTTIKQNPLVEVPLKAPRPAGRDNAILASWTYGLGKTVCLTTDVGTRWADTWTPWEEYEKLFYQIVAWSMRPSSDDRNFSVATSVEEGKVDVVVTAFDKDDEFINLLNIQGLAVGPDGKKVDVRLKQVAPGRYVGQFEADQEGSYLMSMHTGDGEGMIRTGVNVPYSPEFKSRETDVSLLTTLASLHPEEGEPGAVIEAPATPEELREALAVNSFRHDLPKATSSDDFWHYLLLIGSCLFFLDVFFRRVQVSFAWVGPTYALVRNKLLGREPEEQPTEFMSRLRSKKHEVGEEIESRRAAARFEPQPDAQAEALSGGLEEELTSKPSSPAGAKPAKPSSTSIAPQEEEESYTSRLLKAKKRVWDEKQD